MGLKPTKMRQDLKKSVSLLPEGEEKILSFGCDFSEADPYLQWPSFALGLQDCALERLKSFPLVSMYLNIFISKVFTQSSKCLELNYILN